MKERIKIVESCVRGRVDVLSLSETHWSSQATSERKKKGNEGDVWEGMVARAVYRIG